MSRPAWVSPAPAGAQRLIPVLVICAGLIAYHNGFHGPFIFDDLRSIPGNASIRQFGTALSPPPRTAVTGRPIVNLSLASNYALGGLNVWGYHAFNLATHILAALVLYGVVRRTLRSPGLRDRYGDEAPWLALAVALIWVVHPLQTESVTYVIQRTELLMGLFFLLTLYCVIRGVESPHRRTWYAAAIVSSAVAMGSKEVAVMTPLGVLAYDRLFLAKSYQEVFHRRWGVYAGFVGWIVLGALLSARIQRGMTRFRLAQARDYATTQSGVIVHYLRLSFWPDPLVGDYSDWALVTSVIPVLPSAALVLMLLGATLWAFHRHLPVAFLGVWFFLILAPTSSFWPLVGEVVAERRMYLPLAAVIVFVVIGAHMGLAEIWRRLGWRAGLRRYVEAVVLIAIVVTLGHLTVRRNEDYRTTEAFWSDVVAKRPNSARGHTHLAAALYKQERVDEALGHLFQSLRIKPTAVAHYNVGVALARKRQIDSAIEHLEAALKLDPRYDPARRKLASLASIAVKSSQAPPKAPDSPSDISTP